jgi:biopolymer transport protein ExbD
MTDATFDLNLAPFLDIIVSIVPMLLLSIAFVQIKTIEAPTPQVVSQDQAKSVQKPEATLTLHVSKISGLVLEVDDNGRKQKTTVANKDNHFDLEGLLNLAVSVKGKYPQVTKLQLAPEADVAFDELVQIMDRVREKPRGEVKAMSFTDKAVDAKAENRQLFSEIVFSGVGG